MNLELTPDQTLLRDTLRRFVQAEVVPHARQWDRDERFPKETVAELGAMGMLGVCIDPADGGVGLSAANLALVVEEIARADGSLGLIVSSHNGLCSGHIKLAGTPEQRQRFLRPLASGSVLGGLGPE